MVFLRSVLIAPGLIQIADYAICDSLDTYYYFGGGKIPLNVDSTKITIRFADDAPEANISTLTTLVPSLSYDSANQPNFEQYELFSLDDSTEYASIQSLLDQQAFITSVHPVYRYDKQHSFYVGETFVCRFSPALASENIAALLNQYNVQIVHKTSMRRVSICLVR